MDVALPHNAIRVKAGWMNWWNGLGHTMMVIVMVMLVMVMVVMAVTYNNQLNPMTKRWRCGYLTLVEALVAEKVESFME